LKRSVEVLPAFDRRNEDAAQNKGLQGIVLIFRVAGGGGRTEFELHTNWFPDEVRNGFMERGMFTFLSPFPKSLQQYGGDPHSVRTYIDEEHSKAGAEQMFGLMLHLGDDAIWTALERLHVSRFGDAAPEDAPRKPEPEPLPVVATGPHRNARLAPHVLIAAATVIMEAHANGEN
jgi:hypothetical protein